MSLLTTILTDSRHWKKFVVECTNRESDEDCNDDAIGDETKAVNTSNGNAATVSNDNKNENGVNDNNNDNEELPLLSFSLGLVDSDGTTSLLRCYDSVEPPEPEANRHQLE